MKFNLNISNHNISIKIGLYYFQHIFNIFQKNWWIQHSTNNLIDVIFKSSYCYKVNLVKTKSSSNIGDLVKSRKY